MLVEAPGVHGDGVEVAEGPQRGTLALRFEAPLASPDTPALRQERGARDGRVRYQRVLAVAPDADCGSVKVSVVDGILTLVVPKVEPAEPAGDQA